MTEEQIIQKAEEYVSNLILSEQEEENYKFAFIDGAHSRDEEITRLSAEIEDDNYVISKLREELNKLRNPWISVNERLPEESKKHKGWLSETVFVITNKDDGTSAKYDHATKTWYPAKILQGSITHWMPMPKSKEE